MRNLRVFTIVLCAMALAMGGTSCKKDSKQNAGERMVIGAGINQGGGNGSKTYVGTLQNGEYPVLWGEGDEFDLFSENGTEAQSFSIEDGVGKTSGKFEGIDPGGSKYFGFYPKGAGTRSGNTFTYPVEGIGYADGTCKNAPMFGYSADGKNVMFENVMSWVRIGLKTTEGTVHVTSVLLGAKDNAAIMAGTLTVSFDGEGNITNTAMSGDKHSLTVSTNMTVSTTTQYVSFLVPASTATSWIFTVTSDCGSWTKNSYEKTISGGIERNAIYVGEIEVANSEGNGGGTTYSGDVPGEGGGSEGGGSESTLRTAPEGALPYKFTINDAKDYVFFAKGNLWCDASNIANPVWHFEENQYGVNTAYGNNLNHVSHFFCSTKYEKAVATSWDLSDPATKTNEGIFANHISIADCENYDVESDGWFVPATQTAGEWNYILKGDRMENSGKPTCAAKTIEGHDGFCIYPDNYSGDGNETSFADLETNGVVFLPLTGKHYSLDEATAMRSQESGCYSFSFASGSYAAPLEFGMTSTYPAYTQAMDGKLYYAYAIRLVHPGLVPTTK